MDNQGAKTVRPDDISKLKIQLDEILNESTLSTVTELQIDNENTVSVTEDETGNDSKEDNSQNEDMYLPLPPIKFRIGEIVNENQPEYTENESDSVKIKTENDNGDLSELEGLTQKLSEPEIESVLHIFNILADNETRSPVYEEIKMYNSSYNDKETDNTDKVHDNSKESEIVFSISEGKVKYNTENTSTERSNQETGLLTQDRNITNSSSSDLQNPGYNFYIDTKGPEITPHSEIGYKDIISQLTTEKTDDINIDLIQNREENVEDENDKKYIKLPDLRQNSQNKTSDVKSSISNNASNRITLIRKPTIEHNIKDETLTQISTSNDVPKNEREIISSNTESDISTTEDNVLGTTTEMSLEKNDFSGNKEIITTESEIFTESTTMEYQYLFVNVDNEQADEMQVVDTILSDYLNSQENIGENAGHDIPKPIQTETFGNETQKLENKDDILSREGDDFEKREVEEAAEYGLRMMDDFFNVQEPKLYKMGLWLERNNPARYVAAFSGQSPQARELAKYGYAALKAAAKLSEQSGDGIIKRRTFPHINSSAVRQTRLHEQCPLRGTPRCLPASRRYRTADGTCNNFQHPWRGAANTPMMRFLTPSYSDGLQSVRRSVQGGHRLPSAREISTVVHADRNVELTAVTHMLMQWGQFLDHDLTASAQSRGFNGSVPRCCRNGGGDFQPPDLMHPDCLPIEVPRDDWFLGPHGLRCMEFVRSAPTSRIDCELGWREQINQVTSYIDGSQIYGSSVQVSDSLRTFRNGMLQYGKTHLEPNSQESEMCQRGAISSTCFRAGDNRVSEQPGLTAMHIAWLRQHNLLAGNLARLNPHWSDEKIYQETRRIVGAMLQHITYREFLPIVLGQEVMKLFDLQILKKGFYEGYEIHSSPGPASSFAAAAFRFGHSMVQHTFIRTDELHRLINNNVSLHEEQQNPENIWSVESVDRILLGMCTQPSQKRDEFMTEELTNHLFQTQGFPFGMDLAALNIQRGRDHGIPPYTAWREPCGLSEVKNWNDLLKIMSPETHFRLRSLYRHIDDIDLYTGGLAERPVRGALVGPTFACIIAQQFANLRKSDRFWYENSGFESSFSPAQLQQIRKVTLSQILCQSMEGVTSIQPFVFLTADDFRNRRIPCSHPALSNFNLSPWQQSLSNDAKSNALENHNFFRNGSTDELILHGLTSQNIQREASDKIDKQPLPDEDKDSKRNLQTSTIRTHEKESTKHTKQPLERQSTKYNKQPSDSTSSKKKITVGILTQTNITTAIKTSNQNNKPTDQENKQTYGISIWYDTGSNSQQTDISHPSPKPALTYSTTPHYKLTTFQTIISNPPNRRPGYNKPPNDQIQLDYTLRPTYKPLLHSTPRPITDVTYLVGVVNNRPVTRKPVTTQLPPIQSDYNINVQVSYINSQLASENANTQPSTHVYNYYDKPAVHQNDYSRPTLSYPTAKPQNNYNRPQYDYNKPTATVRPQNGYNNPTHSTFRPQNDNFNRPTQKPVNDYNKPTEAYPTIRPQHDYNRPTPNYSTFRPQNNYNRPTERPENNYNRPTERPQNNYNRPTERPQNNYNIPTERPQINYNRPTEGPQNNYNRPTDTYSTVRPQYDYNRPTQIYPSVRPQNDYNRPTERPQNNYNRPTERPQNNYNRPTERPQNSYNRPTERPQNNYNRPTERPQNDYNRPTERPQNSYNRPIVRPQNSYDSVQNNRPYNDYNNDDSTTKRYTIRPQNTYDNNNYYSQTTLRPSNYYTHNNGYGIMSEQTVIVTQRPRPTTTKPQTLDNNVQYGTFVIDRPQYIATEKYPKPQNDFPVVQTGYGTISSSPRPNDYRPINTPSIPQFQVGYDSPNPTFRPQPVNYGTINEISRPTYKPQNSYQTINEPPMISDRPVSRPQRPQNNFDRPTKQPIHDHYMTSASNVRPIIKPVPTENFDNIHLVYGHISNPNMDPFMHQFEPPSSRPNFISDSKTNEDYNNKHDHDGISTKKPPKLYYIGNVLHQVPNSDVFEFVTTKYSNGIHTVETTEDNADKEFIKIASVTVNHRNNIKGNKPVYFNVKNEFLQNKEGDIEITESETTTEQLSNEENYNNSTVQSDILEYTSNEITDLIVNTTEFPNKDATHEDSQKIDLNGAVRGL